MGVWERILQPSQAIRVWRQGPQPPEAKGVGGGSPSARKFFYFFGKNNLILGLFWEKLMRGLEISSAKNDHTILVA